MQWFYLFKHQSKLLFSGKLTSSWLFQPRSEIGTMTSCIYNFLCIFQEEAKCMKMAIIIYFEKMSDLTLSRRLYVSIIVLNNKATLQVSLIKILLLYSKKGRYNITWRDILE